jgi:hypothetical protein
MLSICCESIWSFDSPSYQQQNAAGIGLRFDFCLFALVVCLPVEYHLGLVCLITSAAHLGSSGFGTLHWFRRYFLYSDMADDNMASPEAMMDETEESASSSNLPSTEPVYGGFYGLPRGTSRPQSRPNSCPTTPFGLRSMPRSTLPSGQHAPSGHASALPLGHATPPSSILEAYRLVQDEEMNVLRNGHAAANSNIQLLMEFLLV